VPGWRVGLVAGVGLLAAVAATLLAVAVNAVTGGTAPWFPAMEHHPLWWTSGATVGIAGAGLLVWWVRRWYDRGLKVLVPAVQRPESWVVGRPAEVNQIVTALRDGGTVGITTAVHGAGGFGKTTIARMVRADPRVLRQFRNRVYWVTVGRDADKHTLLRLVNDLIAQIQPGQPGTFTSAQQASDHLAALLTAGPPRLLILDDVWTDDQLAAFPVARQCARLVTTRNPSLDAGTMVKVDQMSDMQARAVLLADLQQPLPPLVVRGLIRESGQWALMLRLVNKILKQRTRLHADITHAAEDVLDTIRRARLQVDELTGDTIQHLDVSDPDQRRRAIRATIEASAGLLLSPERSRFAELGVFAEDETIPVSLVGALWRETGDLNQGTAETMCARLADLALVTLTPTSDGGGIDLHDVIRDFLHKELGPVRLKQLHQVLLDGLVESLPRSPGAASGNSSGPYARRHMAAHAAICGALDSLASDPWFLLAADPGSILAQRGNLRSTEAKRALAAFDLTLSGWGSSDDTRRLARLAANAARVRALGLVAECAKRPVQDWQIRWAAWTGQIYRKLSGHEDAVHAVALGQAADRDVIVSGSADTSVRVWDAVTGDLIQTMTGHEDAVHAVALGQAAGRDVVVSGSADNSVRVWDAVTGDLVRTLTGHDGEVSALAIGRAGGWDVIVSGDDDETVRVWDAVTGKPIGSPLSSHDDVLAVGIGWAGDPDVVICGSRGGKVRVWDPIAGDLVRAVRDDYKSAALAVAIGRAGDRDVIVFGCYDKTVRILDAVTGELIQTQTGAVTALAVGQAGGRDVIVSGSDDDTVRIWDLAELIEGSLFAREDDALAGHDDVVTAVAIGRAGDRDVIVSGSHDKTVRVWDAVTGDLVCTLTGHHDAVTAVAIGRAGDRDVIVSGCDDAMVRIWDAVTGEPRAAPLSHNREKVSVAIGRAGDRDVIVSGSYAKTVRIWDAVTGNPVRRPVRTGFRGILAVAIGRAGDRDVIVSSSLEVLVRVWDAVTGDLVCTLTGHHDAVTAVAIGRAGDRDVIVSGSDDTTVRVWDAVTGDLVCTLAGHDDAVTAVAIGRAGDRDVIVSGSDDTTVRVWDAVTGDPVGTPLVGHDDAVTAVAVSRIGDLDVIASGSRDRAVLRYDHCPCRQNTINRGP
jgi:WD40 repeat protein